MFTAKTPTTTSGIAAPRHVTATPRDLATNALILAVAATLWLGWAHENPPAGWDLSLDIGSGAGLLVAEFAGMAAWRCRHSASAMAEAGGRRRYYRTVGAEAAAIAAGVAALGITGQSAYLAPWILFVVGAHFMPLSRLFGIRSVALAGALLIAASAVAVGAGLAWAVTPSAIAGGAGGAILLAFAVLSLVRYRQVAR